uniref:Odorant binding protein 5 n=1 Tax=Liriomyza sativae TaxID=127406 RepID=A0A0X8B1X5_LIRSA|nr:odorant binding protein 5 [Liriomyza sativae]
MKYTIFYAFMAMLAIQTKICSIEAAFDEEKMKEINEECLTEFGFGEQDLMQFISNKKEAEIASKFKCYIHCLFDRMDILNEHGKVCVKKLSTLMSNSEEANELQFVHECKAMHDMEEDACEYTAKFMMCMFAKRGENLFKEEK